MGVSNDTNDNDEKFKYCTYTLISNSNAFKNDYVRGIRLKY